MTFLVIHGSIMKSDIDWFKCEIILRLMGNILTIFE